MGGQFSKNTAGSHTTGTYAAGGSTIHYTNINYYENAASSSLNKQDLTQDPTKFTQPVVDVIKESAVPLKSPSAEACGYSDRVAQLTLGNSTITTQEAANICVGYGEWPSHLDDHDATAVDRPTHPGVSCERFYTLPSVEWTNTWKGQYWKLPNALTETGMFGQNAQFHYLYRGGWAVHVQCNATKFHQGLLLVVMIPECVVNLRGAPPINKTQPGENGREIEEPFLLDSGEALGNALIYPHQWINLRTNNAATIIVPYVNAIPMDSAIRHSNWTLMVIPVTELAYAANTSPLVPITVTLAPMCTEFGGLRAASEQGLPVLATPGSYQFLTTADFQTPCLLPKFEPSPEIHIPAEVRNLLEIVQVESMVEANNLADVEGAKRYNIPLNVQTGMDAQIFALNVDPGRDGPLQHTLLGIYTRYFTQWSGSLEFTFMFTGTFMTTGKILIAYTPPGAAVPASRREAMLGTHVVWDFGLQSSITLVVPWISAAHFRGTDSTSTLYKYKYYEAGVITGWYQTNMITPPDFPQTASIVAFVAAQSNFSLRIQKDRPDMTQTASLQSPKEAIKGAVDKVVGTVATEHNISTNNTPALQAAETGATSTATDEGMIETRHVVATHGVAETSLESFYGRSSLVGMPSLNPGDTVTEWIINFGEFVQLRAKLCLFTYMRFDIEFTIVATAYSATGDPISDPTYITYQVMYVPPGASAPTDQDTYQWQSGANPSLLSRVGDVPAAFSVPFMGTANAYSYAYDGYAFFNTTDHLDYGVLPSNYLGSMYFRTLERVTQKIRFRIYAKPKHVRAWVPRAPRAVPYQSRYNNSYTAVTALAPNRDTITTLGPLRTTGPFGQQSGAAYVGNYKIMNRHLADCVDWQNLVWESYERDLLVTRVDAHGCDQIARCDCRAGVYYCKSRMKHYPVVVTPPSLVHVDKNDYYPERYQSHVALGIGFAEPGDCGGLLRCEHGVMGILTAGGNNLVAFADIRDLLWIEDDVMEQGLTDYVQSLGNAFGAGFTDEISNYVGQVRDMMVGSDTVVEKIVRNIIKLLSALVIVVRNRSDIVTVTATLSLLGCSGSPWRWLKAKICSILGINMAQKQADGWIKKFTEAVNAFKGLDWIAAKFSKFLDWIKSKIIPELRERAEFVKNLKQLPLLEAQINTLEHSNPNQETQEQLFSNVQYLAHHCRKNAPLYAAEARRVYALEKRVLGAMQFKTKNRIEPVCCLIHGTPGTGKSLATTIIGRKIAEYENSGVYSLPPDPDHFDGYQEQAVVIMDDLHQNPDGKDMSLFCQMVSTTPFVVPMAALEDKGRLFTSKYVLASTNANHIHPVTVADGKALQRRFHFDTDIELMDGYVRNGKLDIQKATEACDDCSPINFQKCMPLICGKALQLRSKKGDGMRYSIDTMITEMRRESARRYNIGNVIEALFQGPPEFRPLRIDVSEETPAPPAIADLLASVDSEDVREYCRQKGWIVQERITKESLERNVSRALIVLQSATLIATICGVIYVVYKLFAGLQGPYSGIHTNYQKVKPVVRQVTTQGPLLDFAMSLLKKNIRTVVTKTGEFTGLGVYDTFMVLPRHAMAHGEVEVDGKKVEIEDAYDLNDTTQTSLELTVIKLKQNEKFRDIRSLIPDQISETTEALVIVNTSAYPNLFMPVGAVKDYGYLNLAGRPTHRTLMYNFPTRAGQCGGVAVSMGKVIGIHIGGNGAQGFAAALLRRYFTQPQGEIEFMEKSKDAGYPIINAPTKTKLHPSVFFDIFPGEKEPAVLHKKDKRLEVDFEEALFSKYIGNIHKPVTEEMEIAIDHYANQLKQLDIDPTPISMEDAIYGTEGLEALDLGTSAGYPYVALGIKKRDILNKETRDVTKMQQCIDKYGLNLPMVTYVKDELRSKEKVKKGKSRLIEASSLNDSVAMRCAFGNLYKAFHTNPGTLTGCAVGCNPETFWSKIPVMMDGELFGFDYTAYDASLSPVWFQCLYLLLEKIGFGHCKHFIDQLCCSNHLFMDKRYVVVGGMPSGCSGTSIFNSMINNIIIRTLVLTVYKNIDLDDLKIIAYGDDVIASYPFELDAKLLADAGKSFGLIMTPPDKSSEFVKLTWDNVTFLKRSFVKDERFPFLIHPVMKMSDIHESIRWTKDAKSTQDHVRSLCLLAWHCGQEQYEEFLEKIRSVPVGRALSLPSFKALQRSWYDSF
ncbi:polyprotein [Enterovirus AN12]|uniref:polyprotein n=1 Tax=Enterovirus AN12 TaxID=1929150 RepID=UPI00097FA8F2|nr:polyprotein [Enterovirus AN12]BAW98044.1 polyprotein [Enterovirus AN12]